jgi:hypothetical protein
LGVVIDTIHGPVPEQLPSHPKNADPAEAAAVSVMDVELVASQILPQLMPPPITVPDPRPVFMTLRSAAATIFANEITIHSTTLTPRAISEPKECCLNTLNRFTRPAFMVTSPNGDMLQTKNTL